MGVGVSVLHGVFYTDHQQCTKEQAEEEAPCEVVMLSPS